MTNHFNLALFPQGERLVRECVELAQANFASYASEYLLGEKAFPHVTLSQFDAEPEKLEAIWSSVRVLETTPLTLRFPHVYVLPGPKEHWGKYFVGLAVVLTPVLATLQKAVYEKLASFGIEGAQPPQSYFPHLTWARCDGSKPPKFTVLPSQYVFNEDHQFVLSLGRSDGNGVYQKRLYPADLPAIASVSKV